MKCHPRRSCWSLGLRVPPETLEKFRNADRLQVDFKGSDGTWLCPTHPDNVQREIDGMIELAKAGADGIMIDFFRYPNANYCFCTRCRGLFEKKLGRKVEPWPQVVRSDPALAEAWSRFRCDTLSEVFSVVSRKVRAAAPADRATSTNAGDGISCHTCGKRPRKDATHLHIPRPADA